MTTEQHHRNPGKASLVEPFFWSKEIGKGVCSTKRIEERQRLQEDDCLFIHLGSGKSVALVFLESLVFLEILTAHQPSTEEAHSDFFSIGQVYKTKDIPVFTLNSYKIIPVIYFAFNMVETIHSYIGVGNLLYFLHTLQSFHLSQCFLLLHWSFLQVGILLLSGYLSYCYISIRSFPPAPTPWRYKFFPSNL